MKPLIFHSKAEAELENATAFYENYRPGYGVLFRQEVEQATSQIARSPAAFSRYKGGPVRRRLLKRFPYGVYYLERTDAIFVIAVMDQRRRPDYWIDRLDDV
jgi:plasmid stabilization system protein ParE